MAEIKIPLKQSPTIDIDDLSPEICISYRHDGKQIVLSRDELLTRLKSPLKGAARTQELRVRHQKHNEAIGMTQSFNAVWRALVEGDDEASADAALTKALSKYPKDQLNGVCEARIATKDGLKGFAKAKRFLNKKGLCGQ